MENFQDINVSDELVRAELQKFLTQWLKWSKKWDWNSSTRPDISNLVEVVQWRDCNNDSILHYICDGHHYTVYGPSLSSIEYSKLYAPYNLLLADRIIELLIKNDIDLNAKNFEGYSPLHKLLCFTIFDDDIRMRIVKLFIEYKANLNVQNKCEYTPLFNLCHGFTFNSNNFRKKFELVKLLIDNGADCNIATRDNETPLSIICTNQYKDINLIKYLISKSNEDTLKSSYNKIQERITVYHVRRPNMSDFYTQESLKIVTYFIEISEMIEKEIKRKPNKDILLTCNNHLDSPLNLDLAQNK